MTGHHYWTCRGPRTQVASGHFCQYVSVAAAFFSLSCWLLAGCKFTALADIHSNLWDVTPFQGTRDLLKALCSIGKPSEAKSERFKLLQRDLFVLTRTLSCVSCMFWSACFCCIPSDNVCNSVVINFLPMLRHRAHRGRQLPAESTTTDFMWPSD